MDLTRKQRLVMVVGGLALVVTCVFPPWVFTIDMKIGGDKLYLQENAGYAPITDPPSRNIAWKQAGLPAGYRPFTAVRIDSVRLLVQVVAVLAATAVLVLLPSLGR